MLRNLCQIARIHVPLHGPTAQSFIALLADQMRSTIFQMDVTVARPATLLSRMYIAAPRACARARARGRADGRRAGKARNRAATLHSRLCTRRRYVSAKARPHCEVAGRLRGRIAIAGGVGRRLGCSVDKIAVFATRVPSDVIADVSLGKTTVSVARVDARQRDRQWRQRSSDHRHRSARTDRRASARGRAPATRAMLAAAAARSMTEAALLLHLLHPLPSSAISFRRVLPFDEPFRSSRYEDDVYLDRWMILSREMIDARTLDSGGSFGGEWLGELFPAWARTRSNFLPLLINRAT